MLQFVCGGGRRKKSMCILPWTPETHRFSQCTVFSCLFLLPFSFDFFSLLLSFCATQSNCWSSCTSCLPLPTWPCPCGGTCVASWCSKWWSRPAQSYSTTNRRYEQGEKGHTEAEQVLFNLQNSILQQQLVVFIFHHPILPLYWLRLIASSVKYVFIISALITH